MPGPYPREASEMDAMSYRDPAEPIGTRSVSTTDIALLAKANASEIWMLDARRPTCQCGAPRNLRALHGRQSLGPVKLTTNPHSSTSLTPTTSRSWATGHQQDAPVHRPLGPGSSSRRQGRPPPQRMSGSCAWKLPRCRQAGTELERLGRILLLVVDEVGNIPFDPEAGALLFALISSR
jgi:hypothetical protein